MSKSAWLYIIAVTPAVLTIKGIDWSLDILCMAVAAIACSLTQWRLIIDKKVITWAAIPLEIVLAGISGFIVHAWLREHIDDLRKLLVYVFGVGFAGTAGLRYALRGFLPQIYGDKKDASDTKYP